MYLWCKKLLTLTLLAGTALSIAACTVSQSPNMVDYSYVPPVKNITVLSAPGIESY